jgi:ribonuclease Z
LVTPGLAAPLGADFLEESLCGLALLLQARKVTVVVDFEVKVSWILDPRFKAPLHSGPGELGVIEELLLPVGLGQAAGEEHIEHVSIVSTSLVGDFLSKTFNIPRLAMPARQKVHDLRVINGKDNSSTGARVLHYPVIHCRAGSMGYKLEWTPPGAEKPLTMIYSSDTKPEWNSILHAINRDVDGDAQGVDVFIHEMAVAPEIWALKCQGLTEPGTDEQWQRTLEALTEVQNSSHTPQGAFGYLLSEINKVKPPRLAVATHFPTADDTVACALNSVQAHCPEIKKIGDQLVWSFDLMVLRVFPDRIEQRRAVVNDFSFNPPIPTAHDDILAPKYHLGDDSTNPGGADPIAQIKDLDQVYGIQPGDDTFRRDGY